MGSTWLDACTAFAAAQGVPAELLADLEAFRTGHPRGGPPPPAERAWSGDFPSLEREAGRGVDAGTLRGRLEEELDGAQPQVFARRAEAVAALLAAGASPAARVLRVGFLVRLAGILEAPPPRARRVRALADFYYSAAVRLRHAQHGPAGVPLDALVAAARWRAVAPGLEHARLEGATTDGPLHANVLRIDPRRVRITVEDCAEAARAGRTFAEHVADRALAAISGGFFLYSETDIEPPSHRHDPVGLLVQRGEVVNAATFRRGALLVGPSGEIRLRPVALDETPLEIDGHRTRLREWWNRAHADTGPEARSVAVVGRAVVAVGTRLAVPLNGFVAVLADDVPCGPGSVVRYEPPLVRAGVPAVEAVAGGPLLRRSGEAAVDMRGEDFWGTAPPITFSQDETGDRNLLARMALGTTRDGLLVAAAVDGRNVERATGMTLAGVGALLGLLGCEDALNLDGGSSKRMLVEGRTVDLATTEIVSGPGETPRIRPVHTAILFAPR